MTAGEQNPYQAPEVSAPVRPTSSRRRRHASVSSLRGRALAATIVLGFLLAEQGFYFVWNLRYLMGADASPDGTMNAIFEALNRGTTLVAAAFYLVMILWLHGAHKNLRAFADREYLRYGSSHAVWPWFVPIFNLIRPFQVLHDVVRGTGAAYGTTIMSTGTLLLVWILHHSSAAVSAAATAMSGSGLVLEMSTYLLSNAMDIVSIVGLLLVIRVVSAQQSALAEQVASAE